MDEVEQYVTLSAPSPSAKSFEPINRNWVTCKFDKQALQNQGVTWRRGSWSVEEVQLLKQNIARYCKSKHIENPCEIIFGCSKDARKSFYRDVGQGLNRPLFSIYRRITRMYDSKNYQGRYTDLEIQQLKELRATHGTNWALIGNVLGRSASSVKDRCRLLRESCNSGKWYKEEESRLTNAVYDLSGCSPEEVPVSGVSWADVAQRVGTRSDRQCRAKWLNNLGWKIKGGPGWTRDDDHTLIQRLIECEVDDENDIDWSGLAEGWPAARSPHWLRTKWWSLKKNVPNYKELKFSVILSLLDNSEVFVTQNSSDECNVDEATLFVTDSISGAGSLIIDKLTVSDLQPPTSILLQDYLVEDISIQIEGEINDTGDIKIECQTDDLHHDVMVSPTAMASLTDPMLANQAVHIEDEQLVKSGKDS